MILFTRLRSAFYGLVLLASAGGLLASPPNLVVVVSLDQFRADYLTRFREHFGPGGFNLLLDQGANFSDCHFRHSLTVTGPGHAVMLTGVHANRNGIIGNEWVDRNTFAQVSCVGDPAVEIVGLPSTAGPRPPGRSPRNLLVTTVGDEWKLARGGRPKVIGISNKDRSAILMAGHLADAAYFMLGPRMVTSTYYMPELPAWVKAWNEAGKADAYFGKVWDRVLPAAAYAGQGPDDQEGEYLGDGMGRTMPKTITGGEAKPGSAYYSALAGTPFASDLLADFARAVITEENLGRRGVTDILCVSFSAPDAIGHNYGPDSHEVMDNAVRTDRILAGLFQFIDDRVGLKNCTIVLTADHGVAPLPERLAASGRPVAAGRIQTGDIGKAAEAALNAAFGPLADKGRWLASSGLIQPAALQEKQVARADVERIMQAAALTVPFVAAAYTRTQLERGEVNDQPGRAALLSFNRERSGDMLVQLKPYYFQKDFGTGHGTPYNYDTHVPLLWYGVGVKPGEYTGRVGVDDLAPTLSHLLGLSAPPRSEGRVLF